MTRLYIDGRMSSREQTNRIIVNETIKMMKKAGRFNENEFRNWLLNQVTGVEINGVTYIFPETFTHDEAVRYFNEIYTQNGFED